MQKILIIEIIFPLLNKNQNILYPIFKLVVKTFSFLAYKL